MKKSFMTRALAMGLSLAMAFSLSAATNVSVASAAATPAMASKQFAVRVGGEAKSYKASTATQKSFKITKATVGNTDKATVKVNSSKKSIKVTPGTVTGSTVVKVTFKNIKTAKTTAKKYRCVVKAAIEPEKPVEPEVVKATKITDAKVTTAKTMTVTFDGAVDTSSATAIKVMRGSVEAPVTAAYATDSKSVVLTSATPFAAGSYTITVGSFDPATVAVVKQTATKLEILNTTVANDKKAYVGFQVLDQYGEPMDNYTGKKLTVQAYNTTKGHKIDEDTNTTKAYFTLNCATQDVTNVAGASVINSIGDDVNVVAYLTDNAGVSTTATLKIANIYMENLEFGEIELGTDKRVTINKTYKLPYTAKTNEGNDSKFGEETVTGSGINMISRVFGNYTFVSSNVSSVDMGKFYVDKDGQMFFTAENTPGTAVITAINNMTGATTTLTIVVNDVPKMSSLDVADTSISWDTNKGIGNKDIEVKAAVVVYDQFGEVVDPKNVRNVKISGSDSYFSGKTIIPAGSGIDVKGLSSDGKYLIYTVNNDAAARYKLKGQTITFTFVSKAVGPNGYVTSTSKVSIADTIEPAALTIVTDPAATVVSGSNIKVKFSVYDQNQNKVELQKDHIEGQDVWKYTTEQLTDSITSKVTYYVFVENTSNLFKNITWGDWDNDKKEYEVKLTSQIGNVSTTDISRTGQFSISLKDGSRHVSSKNYSLSVIKPIKKYYVETADKYAAGDKVKIIIDAYSEDGNLFNSLYNDTTDVLVKLKSDSGNNDKEYKFSPKFVNGTAEVEITAGKKDVYTVSVSSLDGSTITTKNTNKFTVDGAAAAKLDKRSNGKLYMVDSQGNDVGNSEADSYETYADVSVVDVTNGNKDITGTLMMDGTVLSLTNNNKVKVEVVKTSTQTYIATLGGINYDAGEFSAIVGKDCYTPVNHFIKLTIKVGEYSWSTQAQATKTLVAFNTTGVVASATDLQNVLMYQADGDYDNFKTALDTLMGSSDTNYTSLKSGGTYADSEKAMKTAAYTSSISVASVKELASKVATEAAVTKVSAEAIQTALPSTMAALTSSTTQAEAEEKIAEILQQLPEANGYTISVEVTTGPSTDYSTDDDTVTYTLIVTKSTGYQTVYKLASNTITIKA